MLDRFGCLLASPPRSERVRNDPFQASESGKGRNGADTFKPRHLERIQAPGPRVMVRVRPGEIGLAERPEAPSVKAQPYRAAVLFFILAAVAFVPFILAPVNGSVSGTAGSADHR